MLGLGVRSLSSGVCGPTGLALSAPWLWCGKVKALDCGGGSRESKGD